MTTFVFPGQGSQKIGMGQDLFERYQPLVEQASDILGYSIKTLCLDDPEKQLHQTQYTQPALFIVNALNFYKKLEEDGPKPDFVAGHSLGEYNALLAADVFDFATGLRLVQQRGLLMSQATMGGMAAIIGLDESQIKAVLSSEPQCMQINIANYNSPTQFVISGPREVITQSLPLFEQAGAGMVIPLNVSGAFHSPIMGPAAEQFRQFLQDFTFNSPVIPVIANTTAKPYENASHVANHLAEQMTHSVLWTASIHYLMQQGETEFIEVGPGAVLTGLIRRIRQA